MNNEIPVFLFNGFLDSGKTTLIKEIIEGEKSYHGYNSLIIAFEDEKGEESVFNTVDVNELMGVGDFVLKQVSSFDGKNFYSANFTPVLDNGVPIYDENVKGKYIETVFWLKTQYESEEDSRGKVKDVFIHEDSYITVNGNNKNVELTIRIAIEIDGGPTYILCANRRPGEKVYLEELYGATSESVGKNVFKNYPTDKTLDTNNCQAIEAVYDLSYFNGDNGNILFTIPEASTQKITLRIWLEGCDEYCVNEIAGENLSILIKFDSHDSRTVN